MSRRFGRNQRRRAREALAAENARADNYALRSAMESRRADAYKAVIDGIRDSLGDDSIVLDAPMRMVSDYFLPQIQICDPNDLLLTSHVTSNTVIDSRTIRIRTAGVFDCEISQDHWTRKHHFLLRFKDRSTVAYAIDDQLLSERRAMPTLVKQVAKYMAAAFAKLLNEGGLRPAVRTEP